jgi:small subunit ribosomal protein S16
MVTIRLTRVGSKKRPFFRVIVSEARTARDGSVIETLGYYDPRKKPELLKFDSERLAHWLKNGAQPSHTVRTLVERHKNDAPAAPAVTAAAAS